MTLMDTAQLLGNVGEFVGSIVIVVTLIYLAVQIRQNNQALRANFEGQSLSRSYDLQLRYASDRQVAEWWARGADEFAELDSVDQQRLIVWEFAAIELWWTNYLARKRGFVSDEYWHHQLELFKIFGNREAVKAAWRLLRPGYSDEFRQLLDGFIEPGQRQGLSASAPGSQRDVPDG